jgi:hypothetical protein
VEDDGGIGSLIELAERVIACERCAAGAGSRDAPVHQSGAFRRRRVQHWLEIRIALPPQTQEIIVEPHGFLRAAEGPLNASLGQGRRSEEDQLLHRVLTEAVVPAQRLLPSALLPE